MIDRSKRYVRPQLALENIPTLKGKRVAFDSVAEMQDKIAKYKLPEFVKFMKSFPRNPTGKILKHELKKMFV